jgi:hypothetical protein
MPKLSDIAQKIRSKNAGPFWLTIDIFAGSKAAYEQINASLITAQVARLFRANEASIKRFALPTLHVIKLSLPRPEVQGGVQDRDMHGASWAAIIGAIVLE